MIAQIRCRIAILALVALGAACAPEPELTPALEQAVRAEGSAATQVLLHTLQEHLVAAMREGGPAYGIEFCSARALALTDSVSNGLGSGISIKRVSEKHRNPVNAPDEAEVQALRHFERAVAEDGALPEDWVQRTPAGEYRYYSPLTIQPVCLACHGDPATMNPLVLDALETAYPEDLATGYEAGDLRGLVRVTVSAERVEAAGS